MSTFSDRIETDAPSNQGDASGFAQKRLLLLLGGVALSLSLLIAGISWQSHENLILEARTTARNLASALDQHTARTIEAVDLALRIVQQRVESESAVLPDQRSFHGMLKEIAESSPQIRSIIVFDKNGSSILDSNSAQVRAVNSGDRDFFIVQRDNPNQGIFLTSTFRNRINGQWTIIASRRINYQDGSFAGTVVAAIRPEYFRKFYDTIDVGKEGAVNLISTSGSVMIRRPWNDETIGQDVKHSQLFQKYLAIAPVGQYENESKVDGISRVFAYHKQDSLPLISVVGISKNEILSNWRRQTLILIIAAIVILAFVGVLAMILTRALQRLHKSEANADQSARLLKTTLNNMDQGLILVDAEQRIVLYNNRMSPLLDLPEALLASKPMLRELIDYQLQNGAFVDADSETQQVVDTGGSSGDYHNIERTRPNGAVLEIRTVPMDAGGFVRTFADVTARKQSERAQAESDLRHRTILDTAHNAFISIDADGLISAWNVAAEGIFGWPATAVIGRALHDTIVPPALREAHQKGMERYFRTGESRVLGKRLEMSAVKFDGTEFPIELTISATTQAGVMSFHAFVQDISDRKQREAAITDSEMRYRLLAENSSDLIIVTSKTGGCIYVSPAVRSMLGYNSFEFAATPRRELIHPDDVARVEGFYAQLGPMLEKMTSTHRVRHRDGHFVWAEVIYTWTRAFNDNGEPTLIGVFRDITDRRNAEEASLESESRYRLLAETTSDVITRLSLDFKRVYVSPACRELFGYEPEEMIGSQPSDFIHPDDAPPVLHLAKSLVEGGVPGDRGTVTYRAQHKNGHWVWIEAVINLMRDSTTGMPSSLVCVLRDVSERQQQARELEAARDEAEKAARIKSEFLASMSHELRTPLNSIIGFSGLMIRSGELKSPTMERYARLVEGASTTLLAIVNDVLDVSKIEAGEFELDPHPFNVQSLVEDAVELVAHEAGAKGLSLSVHCDPNIPALLVGDANRLRQVLLNLLSNAVKFTSNGRVTVSATLLESNPSRHRLAFAVEDTGIGIPIDKHHRLFKRFSQVDGSTARQFGGTGLGLSICKSLVELMGGNISVLSDAGKGATFAFELTLPSAAAVMVPAKSAEAATKKGAFILLAEDVPMNQELAVALLTQRGHRVNVVADGAAAVDAVMRAAYDLVLMDVQMPVMDGVEATKRIRSLGDRHIALPIIAMTANVLHDDVARFRDAGMNDHIGKPFKHDELFATVERWQGCVTEQAFEAASSGLMAFDVVAHAELVGLTGTAIVANWRAQLAEALRAGPLNEGFDLTPVADRVATIHQLISQAGMLGFVELSQGCAALEAALHLDPTASSASLSKVRQASETALAVIKELDSVGTIKDLAQSAA